MTKPKSILVTFVEESEEADAFFGSKCRDCPVCLEKDERASGLCIACDPARRQEFLARKMMKPVKPGEPLN